MNIEQKSLFDRIDGASKEIGDILQANEIVETEDIQQLCYEALSELFPGGGRKLLQRSKVWKIIQASLNDDNSSVCSKISTSTFRSSSPAPSACEESSFIIDDVECSPIIKPKSGSQCNNNSAGDPTDPSPAKDLQSKMKPLVLNAPTYTFYSDPEIQAAVSEGKMEKKIRERLIRGTMNNMVSASSVPPFNRFPTPIEIEEMAKSLVIAYPCLKDKETGHGVVLKALKRRLSNTKPVVKPQGHCPNKRKYLHGSANKGLEDSKKKKSNPQETNSDDQEMVHVENDPIDGKEVMRRHYTALIKEVEKKKPNVAVVNSYLNKEFSARRSWLQAISAGERVEKLLDLYPCFKDHVEIIEEARRVLGIESSGDRDAFKNECVKLLADEIDSIIYYGISKGVSSPKSQKTNSKILHVLQNLSSIFYTKKQSKKVLDLLYQLKDHEDPEAWCSKRSGNVPVLLLEKSRCYLIIGRKIVAELEEAKLDEGVLALLASFYLLDLDYPRFHEIGLTFLQQYIFRDIIVPNDIESSFQLALTDYKKFKSN